MAQFGNQTITRYGDFILMQPPLQPDTYFLWLEWWLHQDEIAVALVT